MGQKNKTILEKLKQPKNKLRYFSLAAYAVLFAGLFILDLRIRYLVLGLFIVLIAKILFAYQLAKEIDAKAKPKKTKRKKKT